MVRGIASIRVKSDAKQDLHMCWSGSCAVTILRPPTSRPLTASHIVGLIGMSLSKSCRLSKQVLHEQLHTESLHSTTPSLIRYFWRPGQSSGHLSDGRSSMQTLQVLCQCHSPESFIEAVAVNNPLMPGSLHVIQHRGHFVSSQLLHLKNSPMWPWPQSKVCIASMSSLISSLSSEKT